MAWLTGWTYRKEITIDNTGNANALTNYVVLLELNTSTSITAGKMLSDGDDIRFTSADGDTLIDFWFEPDTIDSATTKLWAEVPTIGASSSVTIYIYYGKADAASASSGWNTFDLFEDWTTGTSSDRWTVQDGSFQTITDATVGEECCKLGTSGNQRIGSITTFSSGWAQRGFEVRSKMKIQVPGQYGPRLRYYMGSLPDVKYCRWTIEGGTKIDGTGFSDDSDAFLPATGTVYPTVMKLQATAISLSLDDDATTIVSDTGTLGTRTLSMCLWGWDTSNDIHIGTLRVRKLADPDPTTSAGAEEGGVTDNAMFMGCAF